MIDVAADSLISLSQATKLFPSSRNGRSLNVSTLFRWITEGVRGVKLEAARLGGCWFTTREAIARFSNELTAGSSRGAQSEGMVMPKSGRQADQQLEARGA